MSARLSPGYRRLVLEFSQGTPDAGIVRTAAELARLLGLDLHGLFIEDEALLALAAWPFARELRLPTHEWHPIDPETVAAQLHEAAAAADRLLAGVVAALDIPSHFEVIRGDPIAAIAAFCRGDDILVLAPPRSASGFGLPREAPRGAFRRAAGAVLVVPGGRARRAGPVVAVLADAADPGLDLAARIAVATVEELRILLADHAPAAEQQARDRAAALGVSSSRLYVQVLSSGPAMSTVAADLSAALAGVRESLIVLGRGVSLDTDTASRIAVSRGVPVLIMGAASAEARPSPG